MVEEADPCYLSELDCSRLHGLLLIAIEEHVAEGGGSGLIHTRQPEIANSG